MKITCRVTREEGKHISPAQALVGFSGKLLLRKLKPLRRSRSDKICEKALEQDYQDKVCLGCTVYNLIFSFYIEIDNSFFTPSKATVRLNNPYF